MAPTQKHLSPAEAGARGGFPSQPGDAGARQRRNHGNVLIVSQDESVSEHVARWAALQRLNARAVQSRREAETLVRRQGCRISLIVMQLDYGDAKRLMGLAKAWNPCVDVLAILPGEARELARGSPDLELMNEGAGVVVHREDETFGKSLDWGLDLLKTGSI